MALSKTLLRDELGRNILAWLESTTGVYFYGSAIVDEDSDQLGISTNPLYVRKAPLTYGALATAAMGNSSPAEVVAANTSREALVITNISDTDGYFSIGDGTGLTITTYLFKLAAGESLVFAAPVSQQAISAVCGAASKSVAYQEAT